MHCREWHCALPSSFSPRTVAMRNSPASMLAVPDAATPSALINKLAGHTSDLASSGLFLMTSRRHDTASSEGPDVLIASSRRLAASRIANLDLKSFPLMLAKSRMHLAM